MKENQSAFWEWYWKQVWPTAEEIHDVASIITGKEDGADSQ